MTAEKIDSKTFIIGPRVNAERPKEELQNELGVFVYDDVSEGLEAARTTSFSNLCVYISESLIDQKSINSVRSFMTNFPDIPMILVKSANGKTILKPEEGQSVFDKVLYNPTSYEDFVEYSLRNFFSKKIQVDQSVSSFSDSKPLNYVELKMSDFQAIDTAPFTIFIKIGESKYVRIAKPGDAAISEYLNHYNAKGIESFFVPVEEHENYLSLLTCATEELNKTESVSSDVKALASISVGKQVVKQIAQFGITPERVEFADKFVNQTVNVILTLKNSNDNVLKYLELVDKEEHLIATSYMAALVALELGFETSKSMRNIGKAALLHDIGMFVIKGDLHHKDEAMMSTEEHNAFLKHAQIGADMLRASGAFEEQVCYMVENHHFYNRMVSNKSPKVNLATEIVAASDLFTDMVLFKKVGKEACLHFLTNGLQGFSPEIHKAFTKLLKL